MKTIFIFFLVLVAILVALVTAQADTGQSDLNIRCSKDAEERLHQFNQSRKRVHMKTTNKSKRKQKKFEK